MLKKFIIVFIFFFSFIKVYALKNIYVNGESVIPMFDSNVHTYNYYTEEDTIKLSVVKNENENVTGYGVYSVTDGINTFEIKTDDNTYKINVYKNYNRYKKEDLLFKYLNVINANINFDNDVYDYYIDNYNDSYLVFDYDVNNYNSIVNISNNGNFDGDNVVKVSISLDGEKKVYKFHVNKEKSVFKESNEKEWTSSQNKTLTISVISISSIIIVLSFYFIFIKKYHS